jgi:hypothetical protein
LLLRCYSAPKKISDSSFSYCIRHTGLDGDTSNSPHSPTAGTAAIPQPTASPHQQLQAQNTTEATPLNSVSGVYADKDEVEERIHALQRQLSQQQHEREAAEQQHKRDLTAMKKQLKQLEAVNQIFGGAAAGGLVNAQSAEQAHKSLGEHLSAQTQRQEEQAMAIRELALRMELLIEDNNLNSPVTVEVSGGTGGSAVYSLDKGAVTMGDWVNSKISQTADSPLLATAPLSPAGNTTNDSSGRTISAAQHTTSGNGRNSHYSASYSPSAAEIESYQEATDTGGCCTIA